MPEFWCWWTTGPSAEGRCTIKAADEDGAAEQLPEVVRAEPDDTIIAAGGQAP